MADLSTRYLGLPLANPLVPSASPLSRDLDHARRLEDAGASALVMYSLFEEKIDFECEHMQRFVHEQAIGHAEAESFHPVPDTYRTCQEDYLEQLQRLKRHLDIPVIASLNGTSLSGWVEYGRMLEEAGAGLVLFNRFYQPDIDLDTLEVAHRLELSSSIESLLRIRWVALLYGKVDLSLAVTGGFHTAADALKALLAGADVVHLCSVLLRQGPQAIGEILRDMQEWLEEKEYESVAQLKGSLSHQHASDPSGFERANYVEVLDGFSSPPGVWR